MKYKKSKRKNNTPAPDAENLVVEEQETVATEPLAENADAEGKESAPSFFAKVKGFFGKIFTKTKGFFGSVFSKIKGFFGKVFARLKASSWYKISTWSHRTKIIVSVALVFVLLATAVGVTLGLTLPIREVSVEGDLVLLQGEPYSSGLELTVVRKSGRVEKVPVKDYMISDLDVATSGEQTIHIFYQGRTVEAQVRILSIESVEVVIREGTLKREFLIGESFPLGAVLDISYEGVVIRSIPVTFDMVRGFSSAVGGVYEAKIVYHSVECVFEYKVLKEVESVSAKGKLYAAQGDPLSKNMLTGYLLITVNYVDGTSETITVYDEKVLFDGSVLPSREVAYDTQVEATYRGVPFTVVVEAYPAAEKDEVSSISFQSNKRVYAVGERFDASTCSLVVSYVRFSGSVTIPVEESMVTIPGGFDFTEPTDYLDCSVQYGGLTRHFDLRVISAEEKDVVTGISTNWLIGASSRVPLGGSLDYEEATLSVYYGNGYRTENVPITAEMVSGLDASHKGAQVITITYGDKTLNKKVYVGADENEITDITVYGWSDRTFASDAALVIPSGAELSVSYGYGARSESVSLGDEEVHITGFTPAVVGAQEVTVEYHGFTTPLTVHVLDDTGDDLTLINVKSFGKEYYLDDLFDPELCMIELGYAYGKRYETVTLAEFLAMGGRYETGYNAARTGSYLFEIYIYSKIDGVEQMLYSASVVSVKLPPEFILVTGMTLDKEKAKTSYSLGESADLSSLVITVSYSDDTEVQVPVTGDMLVDFSTASVGSFVARIYCQGVVVQYAYTVS